MNKTLENNKENKNFLNIDSCNISDFCNQDEGDNFIRFAPCEICKQVTLNPINVANVSRLLKVNVFLKNVCPNKELTVGCIIMDKSNTVLAFKSETFTVTPGGCPCDGDNNVVYNKPACNCPSSPCVNTNKSFSFILPKKDLCSSLDLKVKIIANYTHPC